MLLLRSSSENCTLAMLPLKTCRESLHWRCTVYRDRRLRLKLPGQELTLHCLTAWRRHLSVCSSVITGQRPLHNILGLRATLWKNLHISIQINMNTFLCRFPVKEMKDRHVTLLSNISLFCHNHYGLMFTLTSQSAGSWISYPKTKTEVKGMKTISTDPEVRLGGSRLKL